MGVTQVWGGGLVYYGGLIGAMVAMMIFARRRKKCPWAGGESYERPSFLMILDIAAPGVALGQACGRIGCFLNGCCWGGKCALPWAVEFPQGSSPWQQHLENGWLTEAAKTSLPIHPTQLYAVFYLVCISLFLEYMYYRRRTFEGKIAALFLLT